MSGSLTTDGSPDTDPRYPADNPIVARSTKRSQTFCTPNTRHPLRHPPGSPACRGGRPYQPLGATLVRTLADVGGKTFAPGLACRFLAEARQEARDAAAAREVQASYFSFAAKV